MILLDPKSKIAIPVQMPDDISVNIPPGKLEPGSSYHLMLIRCAICQKTEVYGSVVAWDHWMKSNKLDEWRYVVGHFGPRGGKRYGWTCSKACRDSRGIEDPQIEGE